jgi:hypothetical protein
MCLEASRRTCLPSGFSVKRRRQCNQPFLLSNVLQCNQPFLLSSVLHTCSTIMCCGGRRQCCVMLVEWGGTLCENRELKGDEVGHGVHALSAGFHSGFEFRVSGFMRATLIRVLGWPGRRQRANEHYLVGVPDSRAGAGVEGETCRAWHRECCSRPLMNLSSAAMTSASNAKVQRKTR